MQFSLTYMNGLYSVVLLVSEISVESCVQQKSSKNKIVLEEKVIEHVSELGCL